MKTKHLQLKKTLIYSITSKLLRNEILTWYIFEYGGLVPGALCFGTSSGFSTSNSAFRYFSPYPLTDEEELSQPSAPQGPKIPGVSRTTARAHGRTVDILAGGLHRYNSEGRKADLYVCEMCFKYMADPVSWELHKVRVPNLPASVHLNLFLETM